MAVKDLKSSFSCFFSECDVQWTVRVGREERTRARENKCPRVDYSAHNGKAAGEKQTLLFLSSDMPRRRGDCWLC